MAKHVGVTGRCNLCGELRTLSKEHVPPQEAFNKWSVETVNLTETLMASKEGRRRLRDLQQGGHSRVCLCEACNNRTGSWYGTPFADWCHQAGAVINRGGGQSLIAYPYRIYPLRVIKQIATMFLAIGYEGFVDVADDLARFVLNKEERDVPPRYCFYACFHATVDIRLVPLIIGLRTRGARPVAFTELTFPPFAYFMTMDTDLKPHDSLTEITHLGRYSYHYVREVYLNFTVAQRPSTLPADFRTQAEIDADVNDAGGLSARLMNTDLIVTGRLKQPRSSG